jgi:hypothetical protein
MTDDLTLEPCNIRELWDVIKPGIEAIKAEWPEQCTWRVEDVYAAVIAERAVLYAKEDGFAICSISTDEYSNDSDLFIWIAYAYEPGHNLIEKYLQSFIEVARRLGCKGVITDSCHPALAKMEALKPMYIQYKVAVDESTT